MNEHTGHVSLNFFYLFDNDARHLAEMAEKETSKLKSLYARHAIISTVFASEAFINRVFDNFYIPGGYERIERSTPLEEKWILAPLVCRTDPVGTFDRSTQPFQSFSELVKIRNWFAHPKPGNFFPASLEQNSTITTEDGKEVPWISVLPGDIWENTRMPRNPFHLTGEHARTAIKTLQGMVAVLASFLPGKVTAEWIQEIVFKELGTNLQTRLTHGSLWGGYSGLAFNQ